MRVASNWTPLAWCSTSNPTLESTSGGRSFITTRRNPRFVKSLKREASSQNSPCICDCSPHSIHHISDSGPLVASEHRRKILKAPNRPFGINLRDRFTGQHSKRWVGQQKHSVEQGCTARATPQ